jgi:uncharacterized damage-inducible protein DinB
MHGLIGRPAPTEYAAFYATYVDAVPDGDIVAQLRTNGGTLDATFGALTDEQGGHRYAEGKWTVREILGHLIDAERIFAYRALRIARGDATPLPGFDENAYAAASNADTRALPDLRAEWRAARESSVRLYESLPDDAWTRHGVASGAAVSVRALAFITVGHAMHHLRVLHERYGF